MTEQPTNTTTTIETGILKKVESLNLELFMLFCKLNRYKDKLTEPTYKYMADKLYFVYREEFDRMTVNYIIEREQEKYANKKRRKKLIPHESWLFRHKNRAAKYFYKRICIEADKLFTKLEAELSEEQTGAKQENLPISTLSACDELVWRARRNP